MDSSAASFDKFKRKPIYNGIVETSWVFRYATYPYAYTNEDTLAFMGECYLLSEELLPLYVNLKAVVDDVSIDLTLRCSSESLFLTRPLLAERILSTGQLHGVDDDSTCPRFPYGRLVQDQSYASIRLAANHFPEVNRISGRDLGRRHPFFGTMH
jgi:hypothetical protein